MDYVQYLAFVVLVAGFWEICFGLASDIMCCMCVPKPMALRRISSPYFLSGGRRALGSASMVSFLFGDVIVALKTSVQTRAG